MVCLSSVWAWPTSRDGRKAPRSRHHRPSGYRKIADTHKHEAKAFTEDGKRRMRAERAKLEKKLAEAKAEAPPDAP